MRFEHVTFAYDGADPVLRDVSFDVDAGETVALVGATGSGKTTLASLVPRLYDPVEGACRSTARTSRTVDLESLRREIALVSDDAFLFSASLRENIAYARPDATDEEILDAAARAGLAEFVDGAAGRLRDARRRARADALRRPAPARGDRARAASRTRAS